MRDLDLLTVGYECIGEVAGERASPRASAQERVTHSLECEALESKLL
jgi:hypothetical protein